MTHHTKAATEELAKIMKDWYSLEDETISIADSLIKKSNNGFTSTNGENVACRNCMTELMGNPSWCPHRFGKSMTTMNRTWSARRGIGMHDVVVVVHGERPWAVPRTPWCG